MILQHHLSNQGAQSLRGKFVVVGMGFAEVVNIVIQTGDNSDMIWYSPHFKHNYEFRINLVALSYSSGARNKAKIYETLHSCITHVF